MDFHKTEISYDELDKIFDYISKLEAESEKLRNENKKLNELIGLLYKQILGK